MQRKSFALIWGRKIFFGLSFPLSCLLGLLYLQGSSLPVNFSEWFFLVTNLIGYFGLLNILVFYILFYPFARLSPSYYVVRIWSLLLILVLNFAVILDALVFSQYQAHLYSDIGRLVFSEGLSNIISQGVLAGIIGGMFFYAVIIWLRGETIWRTMQGRFYNPVGGIHISVIIVSLIFSKAIYFFNNVHPQFASYFPSDFNYRNSTEFQAERKLFAYPSELKCQAKNNPNLVVITLKEWSSGDFTEEKMPHVYNMKRHGVNFTNHYNLAESPKSGLFTLFYAVPASYESNVGNVKPFFLKELNKRNYEILDYGRNDEDSWVNFKSWSNNRGEETKPYFLSIVMDGIIQESDVLIQNMISILQEKNLLENTHIVITGSYSGKDLTAKIPFIYIDSDRHSNEVKHATSHYDILPTLAHNLWGCKNSFQVTRVGQPLSESNRDWLLSSTPGSFKIHDFKEGGTINVVNGKITNDGNARNELVFSAIRLMKNFY